MATPHPDADFWNPLDLLHRARAADPQAAWALFQAELGKAGFGQSFYAFGIPRTSKQPLLEKLKRGIYRGSGRFVDDVFSELAKRPDLLATEPVAPHCKRSLTPFVWSHAELAPGVESGLSLASELGFSSFVAFPLRNADASLYGNFTVFCADRSCKSWLEWTTRFGPLLHITAQYFQDSLYGCDMEPTSDVALSPRQRECLLWASRGLSTKQIADKLVLSDPVVHEYLSAAKRKLGCATRSHAVARAVLLGLIEP